MASVPDHGDAAVGARDCPATRTEATCSGTPTSSCCHSSQRHIRRRRGRSSSTACNGFLRRSKPRGRRAPRRSLSVGVGRVGTRRHAAIRRRSSRTPGAHPHCATRGAHRRGRRLGGLLLRRLVGGHGLFVGTRSSSLDRDRALLGVVCAGRVRWFRAPLRCHRSRRVPRTR